MARRIDEAQSFISIGDMKYAEASTYVTSATYHASVAASQEAIEFYVKACFLALDRDYPKTHVFADTKVNELRDAVPDDYQDFIPLGRLMVIANLWGGVRTAAKYGVVKTEPSRLFLTDDAMLAGKHAEEVRRTAATIVNAVKAEWPSLA